jgi:PAS domain S-box-containing protein
MHARRNAMRRILPCILIVFLSLGLMGLTQIPQNYTIRVGVYENAPKIYTAADGTVKGFWPDIINYIASKEGWDIVWVPGTWEEGLARLEKNEIDIMPDVGWTAERAEKFTFTHDSVLTSWARIYTRSDMKINTILDLDGKKVAGLSGSLNFDGPEGIKDLSNRFGVASQFVPYQSYMAVFEAIKNHEVDAGITNKDFGDLNEAEYGLVRTPIIIQPTQIQFALTKNAEITPFLARTLDKNIRQLKADSGSIYFKALDTHFGEKLVEVTPRWATDLLLTAGGFILFLLAVSITSRVEVRRQTVKLKSSETRYKTLLENYPDLIFRLDRYGVFLDFHSTTETNLTRNFNAYMGKNITEVFPPEVAEQSLEFLRKTLLTHKIQSGEFHIPQDNEIREFEARFIPSEGDEAIVIIRDITTRKQAEKDLKESEERYHTLARVSPVGIFRTDTTGSTTYVNPTWCRISGLTPDEAMGFEWLKAVHPDDRESLQKNWEHSASEKAQSLADYRFIHPDGSIAWVIGQAVPEYDTENKLVGYVGTITDITERIQIYEALHESQAAERTAKDIKEIIQAANIALTHSLDLNEVMKELLDYLSQIVPFDRARVMLMKDEFRLTVSTSRGYPESLDRELNNTILKDVRNNQLWTPLVSTGKPYVVDDTRAIPEWDSLAGKGHGRSWMGIPLISRGQILGLFSLDKDEEAFFNPDYQRLAESLAAQAAVAIQNAQMHKTLQHHARELEDRVTERTGELARRVAEVEALNLSTQKLNKNLKEAVKKAESADRLKSAFLATMSHELRTPLNSIIGFTGILLQKMVGPLSEEQEKQLGMVQGSARHLLELINDVLDISKIEADQIVIFNEEFDAVESIRKSLEKIKPLADKKGLEILFDVDPASIMITSDRRRVEQILLNLLNNAVKFTEHGQVSVHCRVEKDMLVTSVSDSGIGMKLEDVQTLFKPFRQIDSGITRQYEGTGLGLSICKRLVELLGGEIFVESEPGKGSTFKFTLPMQKEMP